MERTLSGSATRPHVQTYSRSPMAQPVRHCGRAHRPESLCLKASPRDHSFAGRGFSHRCPRPIFRVAESQAITPSSWQKTRRAGRSAITLRDSRKSSPLIAGSTQAGSAWAPPFMDGFRDVAFRSALWSRQRSGNRRLRTCRNECQDARGASGSTRPAPRAVLSDAGQPPIMPQSTRPPVRRRADAARRPNSSSRQCPASRPA